MAAADWDRRTRRRPSHDEMRARILEVAEEQFSRAGCRKTSVSDIAAELGMSAANIYRFFPSRDAINVAICKRILDEIEDIGSSIVGGHAPASNKLERLLSAMHHYNKAKLVEQSRLYDLIVLAVRENWEVIRSHNVRMQAILEEIVRHGVETGEFDVDDPAEAACAVKTAFTAYLHPALIRNCVQSGENTESGFDAQIRFICKALVR